MDVNALMDELGRRLVILLTLVFCLGAGALWLLLFVLKHVHIVLK